MTQEGPGTTIGRYKLLQQIGEGGFGVVYQAEQTEPVHRTVALKILKPGMDTKQVVARFEAERQALAVMDHPCIAKVLDAGATDTGRPYFVMELVKGIPITEFCDQAKLDTTQRLDLFTQVCHAIQHAHQKGIIHRDLKPNNVLVALHDGRPEPKVIDFGIAKATEGRLTDKTLFTEFKQMIGTPEYMAPEQAEMSGLDIDTRADIYSLGMILYELLTGTKPFDLQAALGKGYDEMLRAIREVDPQRPSTRVSTMGEQLVAVADQRHTLPRLLGKTLKGELDWIIMKALEKDRSRRYETANGFALDIQRYLSDQPVIAGPPSKLYRARKYAKRHRAGVAAGSIMTVALVTGTVLAFTDYVEASTQRDLAETSHKEAARDAAVAERAQVQETEQRTLAEAEEKTASTEAAKAHSVVKLIRQMLGSANPHEVKGRNYTVRQLLDDFDRELGTQLEDQPEVEAMIRGTMGAAYRGLGLIEKAERHDKASLEIRTRLFGDEHPDVAESLDSLARTLHAKASYDEAERLHRKALAILRKALGDEHPAVATVLCGLALDVRRKGDDDEAEKLYREALAILRKAFGNEHHRVAVSLANLAQAVMSKGDYREAEKLSRDALQITRKALGDEHPSAALSHHVLARVLMEKGEYNEAETLQREALAIWRNVLGEEHPNVVAGLGGLAQILLLKGDYDEAEKLSGEALALARKTLGEKRPQTVQMTLIRARVLDKIGVKGEAEKLYREGLAVLREVYGDKHPEVATCLNNLGVVLTAKREFDEAERLLREALAIRRKLYGDKHPGVAINLDNLGQVLQEKGNSGGAEKLYREALAIYRARGDDGPWIAMNLAKLGWLLHRAKGTNEEAEKLLREALAIWRKVVGDEHRDVATLLSNLAAVRRAEGDLDEAEKLHREALPIKIKAFGAEHSDVATSLNDLAMVLRLKGSLAEAETLYRKALAIWRKVHGAEHRHVGTGLNNLAMVFYAKGDFEEAEKHFRAALAILRKTLGDTHDQVTASARSLLLVLLAKQDYAALEPVASELHKRHKSDDLFLAVYGLCLLKQGKHAEAEPVLSRCLALRTKTMPDRWLRFNAMSMLGESLAGQDKHAEAEPLLIEGYEKMAPPEPAAFRKREALERIVKLYEAWGKLEKAAEWSAKAKTE